MKKNLLIVFILYTLFAKAQVQCIYCYNQNDSISNNVNNLLLNGGFENTLCSVGDNFCPNSSSYNCNLGNWICTGGGIGTYSRVWDSNYTIVPEGNKAVYFGNYYCSACPGSTTDTGCFISNGCAVTGIQAGFPLSSYPLGVTIQQAVSSLVIGNTYVLEFWVGGEGFGFLHSGLFAVDVGFGNIFLRNKVTRAFSTDVGTRYLIEFNATSTTDTIRFTNWGHVCNDCTELVLDDVRLYSLLYLSQGVPLCSGANIISHFSAPNHLCRTCTDFTNLSHNATSYQWYFPGATPDTSTAINPTNICYPNLGGYDVTLIATGPSGSDTLIISNYITVVDTPLSALSANPIVFCENNNTDFTNLSTNAYTYQWNFPGGTPSSSVDFSPQNIFYNSPGQYDVTLISKNSGCNDTLILPDYITVNAAPQSSFLANSLNICPGSCVDFTNGSSGAMSYQWYFPGATIDTSTLLNPSAICYNSGGQYDVVLVSSSGVCTDSLAMLNYITVFPQPSGLSVIDIDDTLIADQGFVSYHWYFNGNIINGATNYFYIAQASGDYNVVALDANGCEVEAAIFNVVAGLTPTLSKGEGVTAAPNPVSDKLILTGFQFNKKNVSVRIYNMIGEMALAVSPLSFGEGQGGEANVSQLLSGMYYLEIKSNEKTFRTKFIKQ